MKSQSYCIKIMITLLLLCSSIILNGCGTKRNERVASPTAVTSKSIVATDTDTKTIITPTLTPTIAPSATPTIAPTTTPAIITGTVLENVAKDIDSNKVDDNIQIISLNEDGGETGIYVYLNRKKIFEYENPNCRIMGIDSFEYLDLDGDNKKEIFISASTNANSRPYTEVLCLKQTNGKWNQMDLPKNESGDKEFPFKITRGKDEFDFIISSNDTNQVIHYDASRYFNDDKSDNIDSIQSYRSNHYKEGDKVGFISAWGIWEAKTGTYKERNCIIAYQGIEGPYGHGLGRINIYFAYTKQGKVDILNVKYSPE